MLEWAWGSANRDTPARRGLPPAGDCGTAMPGRTGPESDPPPAAAANPGTAACSIGTPRLDRLRSLPGVIPAAKSALRRGEITLPTRRHGLMALFQYPPHRLATYHV